MKKLRFCPWCGKGYRHRGNYCCEEHGILAMKDSNRQIRGQILTVFTEKGLVSKKELYSFLNFPQENINKCLSALQKEGFVIPLENETAEPEMVYRINIL